MSLPIDSPHCGECSHGKHVAGRCWPCFGKQGTRPHPTCYAGIAFELAEAIA